MKHHFPARHRHKPLYPRQAKIPKQQHYSFCPRSGGRTGTARDFGSPRSRGFEQGGGGAGARGPGRPERSPHKRGLYLIFYQVRAPHNTTNFMAARRAPEPAGNKRPQRNAKAAPAGDNRGRAQTKKSIGKQKNCGRSALSNDCGRSALSRSDCRSHHPGAQRTPRATPRTLIEMPPTP